MKLRVFAVFLVFLSHSCFAKSLSDFEIMLDGFPSCQFENLYVNYTTHVPQHQYFTARGLMPNKVENEAAFFTINERFHGIVVDEIVISAGFSVVSIRLNASLNTVKKQMRGFLKYGFNKKPRPAGSEAAMLTPVLEADKADPQKTNLRCDFEPNY